MAISMVLFFRRKDVGISRLIRGWEVRKLAEISRLGELFSDIAAEQ